MRDRLIFTGQLLFTLLVAAFLVVPAILSIFAGITVNYFRGIQSGVTLQWVFQVWDLYAGTILLSFVIAFATLAVTLLPEFPQPTRCMSVAGASRGWSKKSSPCR